MGFQQAAIGIEREKEFAELQSAIERVFGREKIETLFKHLRRENVRVRDWDSILAKGILEKVGDLPATARDLYGKLTVSDQAQIREFYLFRLEEVDPNLRTKFHKIYQYY